MIMFDLYWWPPVVLLVAGRLALCCGRVCWLTSHSVPPDATTSARYVAIMAAAIVILDGVIISFSCGPRMVRLFPIDGRIDGVRLSGRSLPPLMVRGIDCNYQVIRSCFVHSISPSERGSQQNMAAVSRPRVNSIWLRVEFAANRNMSANKYLCKIASCQTGGMEPVALHRSTDRPFASVVSCLLPPKSLRNNDHQVSASGTRRAESGS
jgi:hypothetical protein